MRSTLKLLPFACILSLQTGCSFGDDNALDLTASASSAVLTLGEEVRITVTAVNRGSTRVSWGWGSSTCQLHFVVRLGARDYPAATNRICTADWVEAALNPGESRTEHVDWTGWVVRDSAELLPAGTYDIRGAAGKLWKSPPVALEVVTQ